MTELNYNPGPPSSATLTIDPLLVGNDLEFIEVHNPTAHTVDLTHGRLRSDVDFDFDSGTSLAPGEKVVIAKFNPENSKNINRLNAFQAR